MDWPIALSTHLFVHHPLRPEHLSFMHEHGFTRMELWTAFPHVDYHDEHSFSGLVNSIHKASISVVSVHAPFYRDVSHAAQGQFLSLSSPHKPLRDESVAETKLVLSRMELLGSDLLIIHPGGPDDWDDPSAPHRLMRSLEELIPVAEACRVRLALENMPYQKVGYKLVMNIIEEMSSPWVGLAFDLGHARVANSEPSAFQEGTKRAWVIHAHDNWGRSDDHLLPFEAAVPWPLVIETMAAHPANTPVVLELRCRGTLKDMLHQAESCAESLHAQIHGMRAAPTEGWRRHERRKYLA